MTMTNRIGDQTLGLRGQALAVLAMLSEREPDFAEFSEGRYEVEIDTRAWYNGRERGIALVLYRFGYDGCIVVTFGEMRTSDGIFVDHWEMQAPPYNGPTIEHMPDRAYYRRKEFPYGNVGAVVDHILGLMACFYRGQRKTAPNLPASTN